MLVATCEVLRIQFCVVSDFTHVSSIDKTYPFNHSRANRTRGRLYISVSLMLRCSFPQDGCWESQNECVKEHSC
jgi:hypothetical protein